MFGSMMVKSSRESLGVRVRASGLLERADIGVVEPPMESFAVGTAETEAGPGVDTGSD